MLEQVEQHPSADAVEPSSLSEQMTPAALTPVETVKPAASPNSERLARIQTIVTTAATEVLAEVKTAATEAKTRAAENLAPNLVARVRQVWQQARQKYQQVQHQQTAFESQLETKIGQLGTTAAGKEQQIKRQIKQWLLKTSEKL